MALDAAAVAVRLRRLWLGEVMPSPAFIGSDIDDDLRLRRISNQLVASGPYDFGLGDPFGAELGALVRSRIVIVSGGVVTELTWHHDGSMTPQIRPKSSDLDVLDPGDPGLHTYGETLAALRTAIPEGTPAGAREAIGRLRLVAVSRHRLWFAAPSQPVADAIGTVSGARAALVTAIQRHQRNERPLYRVVVDASYRTRGDLL